MPVRSILTRMFLKYRMGVKNTAKSGSRQAENKSKRGRFAELYIMVHCGVRERPSADL